MKQILIAFWLGRLTATTALAENQAEFPGHISPACARLMWQMPWPAL